MGKHRLSIIQGHLLGSYSVRETPEEGGGLRIQGRASRDCNGSGDGPANKITSPEEAAQLVKNGDWITVGAFDGIGIYV